jgi:hypothetical protein
MLGKNIELLEMRSAIDLQDEREADRAIIRIDGNQKPACLVSGSEVLERVHMRRLIGVEAELDHPVGEQRHGVALDTGKKREIGSAGMEDG